MTVAITVVMNLTANAQIQRVQPYSGLSLQELRSTYRSENFDVPTGKLNEKQRAEIQKIRAKQLKERIQTSNLLKEKRAKLEVLQTADQPDMKEIDKLIDEIAAIQAEEMKDQAASRQKIRSLLTEEQRTIFDARGASQGNMRFDFRTDRRNNQQKRNHFEEQ